MPEVVSLPWLTAVVVGGGVAGLVVHELGHLLAAGALGATNLRLRFGWPALQVEATLPQQPGALVVFLLAGAFANAGAAAALWSFGSLFRLAALLQIAVAVLALLPIGTSDGASLLAHWNAQRDGR